MQHIPKQSHYVRCSALVKADVALRQK